MKRMKKKSNANLVEQMFKLFIRIAWAGWRAMAFPALGKCRPLWDHDECRTGKGQNLKYMR